MLHVHSSNRLERLLSGLLNRINNGDPFQAEVIVVQNQGMSRWLGQKIAEREGIAANLEFVTPANFLWRAARCWLDDLSEHPSCNKVQLQWRIFYTLPEYLSQSAFQQLHDYLQDDKTTLQRFQLASVIANTFDQYLVYRPDLIERWQQGKDVHWQALLWRAISDKEETLHWGDVRKRLLALQGKPPLKLLPPRVSVFGLSDMAPLYLDLLQIVAAHTEVIMYYLNPCEEYWADIEDDKTTARKRARAYRLLDKEADPVGLLELTNPLLASWGHAGQAFLDQLLEREVQESDDYVQPVADSLLSCVQQDILNLQDRSAVDAVAIDANDHSVQVHGAHSQLREVQVLHDQLLNLFANLKDLQPRDIIVMAPDIDRYAPFVEAVFGTAPSEQTIPWSISDRRLRSEQQLLEAFASLLQLPMSRFESSEIMALLQVPAIRRKFNLERSDLHRLRQWIRESGIRWSLDADMRTELGLPAQPIHSWQYGLERMFLGYALPIEDGTLYEDVSPYNEIEGTDSELLEKLQQIIDLCRYWRARLKQQYNARDWLSQLDQISDAFFEPDHQEAHAIKSFRDSLLNTMLQAEEQEAPIGLAIVQELIHGILEDTANVRQFLTGRVSFSNMVPMRSIPFRVVCLIGMNADDFPRDSRPPSFDLMMQNPRRGDRARGKDDRYLFLETLLSARELFYLSYVSKEIRDNSDKAPATVVTELLAYVNAGYQRSGVVEDPALGMLQHPLQPFGVRYFNQSHPRYYNYKPYWFQAASIQPQAEVPPFLNEEPSQLDEPATTVSLNQLLDFYRRPAASYLFERLSVRLAYAEEDMLTTEQFSLDALEQWSLDQNVHNYGKGLPRGEVKQTLDAQGILPEGVFGDILFEQSYKRALALDSRVIQHEPKVKHPAVDLDLQVGRYTLQGYLNNLGNAGFFTWRSGKKRISDVLSVWIQHLCLCAVKPEGIALRSTYVFREETIVFTQVSEPLEHLQNLLELRHDYLVYPQPFFTESSAAFVQSEGATEEEAARQADKVWQSSNAPPEAAKNGNDTLWRGLRSPVIKDFKELAATVYSPLEDYMIVTPESDELPDELADDLSQVWSRGVSHSS